MLKVFFNLRKSSRERMWDTAREAARVCKSYTPTIAQQSSLERSAGYTRRRTLRDVLKRLYLKLPILNRQLVGGGANEADVLYMWGAVPKGSKKPYIIELDNPYALAYYRQRVFRWRRSTIQKVLRRAQRVVFLSAAARNHAIALLGQDVAQRSSVLMPFMERNYQKRVARNDETVKFLFVGLGFRRKGGPELLEAFSRLPDRNARLTVVAHVDQVMKERYQADTRITFIAPQSRTELFTTYYPNHDVLVFPSLHESLGVVVLEAVSFGLGVVTTNVYATPELVTTGVNGILLEHPFLSPTVYNGVPVVDCVTEARKTFSDRYFGPTLYEQLVCDTAEALVRAMREHETWQLGSVARYEERFAPEVWAKNLNTILAFA